MATLEGNSIASTYKDLLQVSNSNSGITGDKTAVEDGEGTASPLELSSTAVNISSGFEVGGSAVTSTAAELNMVDGSTAGTAVASKALVVDANKDLSGIRNLIISGGISAKPYYGVSWDESADSYTRTGALTGVATGSPSEFMAVHEGMKRCVLADDGGVVYFLDADDSTLKADGSASDLTGGDGQVMVEIPKFYIKYGYTGTTHRWEISTVARSGYTLHPAFMKNGVEVDYRYIGAYEGSVYDASASGMVADGDIANKMYDLVNTYSNNIASLVSAVASSGDKLCSLSGEYPNTNEIRACYRTMASNRSAGWRQLDFDLASAVQLLYLIEYNDFDSQVKIGGGRTNLTGGGWTAGSYIGQCGLSNSDGNGTNSVMSGTLYSKDGTGYATDYMSYRGIENLYGNVWKFVDGININDHEWYVSNNDSDWDDDTAVDYTSIGTAHTGSGWQGDLEQISRGFLPADVTGSDSTKITDYYWQNSDWRVFLLGGSAGSGSIAGVFYLGADYGSSLDDVVFGSRVCY